MTSTSDTFVPIVSSSPPPIDFGSSEDEDDEFGTFSAAKVEESDSSPEKGNKADNRHFFPIDIPSGNRQQTNEENSIHDRELKAPKAVLSNETGRVRGKQENEVERTTTVSEMWGPHANNWSEPNQAPTLSNGISRQESSHGSSDSLEFIQSGERVNVDTSMGVTDAAEDYVHTGIKNAKNKHASPPDIENNPPVSLSSSKPNTNSEDHKESNWGDFDSFHTPKEIESPETPRTENNSSSIKSRSNFPDTLSGDALSSSKMEGHSISIGTTPDGNNEIDTSISELPVLEDTSPSSGNNDDDEFGDFGSFAQNVKETTHGKGDGFNISSISSSKVAEDDFDKDFASFQSTSVQKGTIKKSHLILSSKNENFGNDGAKSGIEAGKRGVKLKNNPSKSSEKEDDDDFAEFSAFKSDIQEPGLSGASSSVATSVEPKFAAFDAFGGQESSTGSDWASFGNTNNQKEKESNNFGDFGNIEAPRSNLKFDDDEDDDFASFESSRSRTLVKPSGSLRINQVLNGCFPDSAASVISSLSISLQPLSGLINSKESHPGSASLKLPKKSPNGLGVWAVLSDMENTKAMGYQWTKSDSKKKLLSSLGLDERNILASRLGGVPKFASDLGMLQPSKPGEAPLQPETLHGQEEQSLPAEESVPKVEFDWSGSGLVNPLDANKLNLDFFATETKSSTPSYKSKSKTVPSIDPDILDLEAPSDPVPALATSKSAFKPLDEILKSSSISMIQQPSKRESDLSDETNQVLDGLPDLSFMLAKVLMFPIKSRSSPPGGGGTKMEGTFSGGLLD